MQSFLHKHAADVIGILSGFDRLVFRGTVRALSYVEGMRMYLSRQNVLLKDFESFVKRVSREVKDNALALAERLGRPHIYLSSPRVSKEAVAKEVLARDPVETGLVCALSCVELSRTFAIVKNKETKKLDLVARPRPCLHVYHYSIHPRFGFMYTRLSTWFPFVVQVGINGREWLSRQMDQAGLGYERRDNTFAWVEDFERAQRLLDRQKTLRWPYHLNAIVRQIFPSQAQLDDSHPLPYYFSTYQSEWATDVSFRDQTLLDRLYPRLIHHGMLTFKSPDVLRFLGHRLPQHGGVHGHFQREVTSDIKHRQEGLRIKHRVGHNSIKAYNKGNNLRVETTINRPQDFKVYRTREGQEDEPKQWLPMRQGVADLYRRAQVSQASNRRYLRALAKVDHPTTTLAELVDGVCHPTTWNGRRVRAFQPWSPTDLALLQAINRGEYLLNGFRNRDLRAHLYPTPSDSPHELRRLAAKVTRQLRLLRAHGLIAKVPKTHRYTVTDKGRAIAAALLAARRASTESLIQQAA